MNLGVFREDELESVEKLLSFGAEQSRASPRVFYVNGHSFYIHPKKGIIDL